MLEPGDEAPDVTVPLANGDVDELSLARAVEDGPIVLAFFPGAFTSVCSSELGAFDEQLAAFEDAGATVYGVSVDTPFAQNAFRDDLGLDMALVSDSNRTLVDAFGVAMDFTAMGVYNLAKRSVFVLDRDRTVAYAWASDDPAVEPDYDAVLDAVQSL